MKKAAAALGPEGVAIAAAIEQTTRKTARQVTQPTRKAAGTLSAFVWRALGVMLALALLLLILRAAEQTTRISDAADYATGTLRRFVNPFGDGAGTLAGGKPAQISGGARAAAQATSTSTNPHTVRVYA